MKNGTNLEHDFRWIFIHKRDMLFNYYISILPNNVIKGDDKHIFSM